jgi:hypothetical protein
LRVTGLEPPWASKLCRLRGRDINLNDDSRRHGELQRVAQISAGLGGAAALNAARDR